MTSSRTLRLPGRRRGRLALWLVVGLSVLFFLISPLIQLLAEWPWFSALAVSSGWMPVLQFLNQTAFGVTDPVFGRDLGYYVFTLPIIGGVLGLLMFLVVVALLASGALYALRGDVVIYRKNLTIEPSARLHLALLLAVLFVLTALRVYF